MTKKAPKRDLQHPDDLLMYPHSTLVSLAKAIDANASLGQSKEALVAVLTEGTPLPPDPIQVIRRRLHGMIELNYDQLKGVMDADCEKCFHEGQQRCPDMRAIVEYVLNMLFCSTDL